jgi:hypothetical protein
MTRICKRQTRRLLWEALIPRQAAASPWLVLKYRASMQTPQSTTFVVVFGSVIPITDLRFSAPTLVEAWHGIPAFTHPASSGTSGVQAHHEPGQLVSWSAGQRWRDRLRLAGLMRRLCLAAGFTWRDGEEPCAVCRSGRLAGAFNDSSSPLRAGRFGSI